MKSTSYSETYVEGGVMGRPRKKLDVERIVYLYTVKKMSVREIGPLVGASHDTVIRRLRDAGVTPRRWLMPGEV